MESKPKYGKATRRLLLVAVCFLSLVAARLTCRAADSPVHDGESRSAEAPAGARSAPQPEMMPEYVRGLFLLLKSDFWGAIDSFRKVQAVRPDEAAVHYSMSRAYYGLAVLDSARVHGEAAVILDPGNTYYARALARISHDMQDYDKAAALYGQVAQSGSDRTDMMYMQALEYLSANHPEQALEVFDNVVKIDPLNEEALSQALLLQIRLKRHQQAIVTLKQIIGLGQNDAKLQLTLGELYAQNGQGDLAVDTFKALLAADRHLVPAWVAMFDFYIKAGRLPDYIRELHAFLDTKPVSADTVIDIARLFLVRSEKDSLYVEPALGLVDEIISRYPRDSRIYMLKGIYQMRREMGREAVASLKKSIQLDGSNFAAWEYLITIHLDLDESRKAFDYLAKAKRRHPLRMAQWKTIEGYALMRTGSPWRAARILETVVRAKSAIRDQDVLIQANTTLAMAYDTLGRKKSCREAYGRVLELDGHNTLAMNNLAYLYAEEGLMLSQALQLAQNAVMLDPDNGVFLDTLGWVHYRLGSYDLARQMIEKAIGTGLDEPEVFRHLAQVYEKLGNPEKAGEMFEKAKTPAPKASR